MAAQAAAAAAQAAAAQAAQAEAAESWYLALLGFAEHFRTSSPPKIRLCVHCLQAVFPFKPPQRIEARTHLQLGSVLYHHTKNSEQARSHLEKAVSAGRAARKEATRAPRGAAGVDGPRPQRAGAPGPVLGDLGRDLRGGSGTQSRLPLRGPECLASHLI